MGMTTNQHKKQNAFAPLIVDVAVPLGSYYLFRDAFGMSTFAALAWSSVVPAGRTLWSALRERAVNGLAGLILVVNVVGLVLSFVAGDPRLMLAKDSGVSSTVGIGILVSVMLGRPMMTAGLKPFLVKSDAVREAAWARLESGAAAASADFRGVSGPSRWCGARFCSPSAWCGSSARTPCRWTPWCGWGRWSW